MRQVARRYNKGGPEGLGDRRHDNPGGAQRALLDAEGCEELRRALGGPPADGGLWSSGRKAAEWIEGSTGRRGGVRAQRGWKYLRKLGHTPPQVPRPANAGATPEEQEAFKKSSPSAQGRSGRPARERSGWRRGRRTRCAWGSSRCC